MLEHGPGEILVLRPAPDANESDVAANPAGADLVHS